MEIKRFFGRGERENLIAKGENGLWKVTSDGTLVLFGSPSRPLLKWTKEEFQRLTIGFVHRMIEVNSEREDGGQMSLEALQVEDHVAKGFWLNGDLTLEQLQQSQEEPKNEIIRVPNFMLEGLRLDIRRTQYYDSWQYLVDRNPNGFRVVRHIPDALAVVASEETI